MSRKYTPVSSFSLSLSCLAAAGDLFVSCGDPSTSLMERESNAALLLCYVTLAFATLTSGWRWPVDFGPSQQPKRLEGRSVRGGSATEHSLRSAPIVAGSSCCLLTRKYMLRCSVHMLLLPSIYFFLLAVRSYLLAHLLLPKSYIEIIKLKAVFPSFHKLVQMPHLLII